MRVRTHYSSKLISRVLKKRQDPCVSMKPRGLWYSVDGDWERWCEEEEFGDLYRKIAHDVTLGAERMAVLRTKAEILRFGRRFGMDSRLRYCLDWPRIAGRYDGLEIAPYCWDLRLDSRCSWYYPWDCASGCIWRPKGVTITAKKGQTT